MDIQMEEMHRTRLGKGGEAPILFLGAAIPSTST